MNPKPFRNPVMAVSPPRPKESSIAPEVVLASLLANMPGHLYWKDRRGVYLGCNNRQAHSLGLTQGNDVIGKTDFDLPWGKQAAQRYWKNDQKIIETGIAKTIEEPVTINGRLGTVLSLKAPLKDQQGQILGVIGISIDITQQKRMETKLIEAKEAAEKANEAKSQFLDNMRHDIRTPLVGITGCAQVIYDWLVNIHPDPDIKDYAEDLIISSKMLSKLLNGVLESIKVSQNQIPLTKQRFSLKEKLTQILQLVQARAKEKSLALKLTYDEKIPAYLLGDAVRLQRTILELITNALNFTHKGQIEISATVLNSKEYDIIIKLQVLDTGIGIALEQQMNAFTRFKRGTPSYEGVYQGAGLGLSIIKQFMDDMDGEICLESTPQKGSTFTCIIPFKISVMNDEDNNGLIKTLGPTNERSPQNTTDHQSIKVLLVEDNKIAAKVTIGLLTQLNCHVELAQTGLDAVEMIKTTHYDLVFLDIGLPDIDGLEVARRIRAKNSFNERIIIIALSAHTDEEYQKEYINAGINGFIPKPLTMQAAQECLLDLFRNR